MTHAYSASDEPNAASGGSARWGVLVVRIGPRNVWYVLPVEVFAPCKNLRFYPDIECKSARWESYREAWRVMGVE